MEKKEAIRNAYKLCGSNSFYDGMMTYSTVLGKMVCKLVWGMNGEDCHKYQNRAMAGIADNFSGKLLEVPVGTGVLSMPIYQILPQAEITCVDYSADMMAQAEEKARKMGLANVNFLRGDVGQLPFANESFDIVLSLNGFHAFPDKEAAYCETFRVLRSGGTFCGCFYVKGLYSRTDWFIKHLYQPLKFFTPPYESIVSLKARLEKMYVRVEIGNVKGIAWFVCQKG